MDNFKISIPRSSKRLANNEIYKYYAGFSEEFIEDLLRNLKVNTESVVLDPWNGSGTTTYVSAYNGINAIGIDLNPMMYIISKAMLQTYQEEDDDDNLLPILKKSRQYRTMIRPNDPLYKWFEKKTIMYIRNIERAILNGLSLKEVLKEIDNKENEIEIESCFLILVLINVIKKYSQRNKSTNPTWIKSVKEDCKIKVSREVLEDEFIKEYIEKIRMLKDKNKIIRKVPKFKIGNSEQIELQSNSVDYVITSPPYCTRIDYAVMTSVELALLGINEEDFIELRHSLTGGPVIHQNQPKEVKEWGSLCINTLNEIRTHYSRASESYYFKTYTQYFSSMYASFVEINRVLKSNSKCVIVVQDSFYKEIFIDLKGIFIEFALGLGWKLEESYNFEVKRNLMKTNPKSRMYKKNNNKIVEHVLIFKKGV